MEIARKTKENTTELKLSGRLDAYWAEHLAKALDEVIGEGSHRIQLNMSTLSYLSSAGIRVLMKYYKDLRDIQGSLTITNPSEMAYSILELAGLASFMVEEGSATEEVAAAEPSRVEKETTVYYIYPQSKGASLECTLFGRPEKLLSGGFGPGDSEQAAYPESTYGVGIGAFGENFEDCKSRFGEFISLAGIGAYLPTDGGNVPDYVISEGLLVPQFEVLYGLSWKGEFANLVRFDAKPEPPGVANLSEIVEFNLEASGAETIGMVIIAECASLVGATLKRSPGEAGSESPLEFPEVRDWLSFTAERAFERSLAVLVGVATRRTDLPFQSMLRPLGLNGNLHGHFHAAVFPYRPLQRGEIELYKTIHGLFTSESLQSIIHLLNDDREMEGVGQSEFLRGACWVGPITVKQS